VSRQFRSDDTSKWYEGFGLGLAGPATLSGTYGGGVGGYFLPFTGTSGNYTGAYAGGFSISYGGWPCLLHQTQGTGAGNWELNKLTNGAGTTLTFKYPLQNSYTTGAQIILMIPYNGITISGTLTTPAWNGSTGGIIALLDKGTTTITGTVTASGLGFRGGYGATGYAGTGKCQTGFSGEGATVGINAYGGGGGSDAGGYVSPASGNTGAGGGGGLASRGTDGNTGGGGGGHATAGSVGVHQTAENPSYNGGEAGAAIGNVGLISLNFGQGGGGGGIHDYRANNLGAGGAGGGIIFLLSKNFINSGAITTAGTTGGVDTGRCGGGGAGGAVLIKAQTATLGTITAAAGTGAVGDGNRITNGGAGSVGRIHLDYKNSYSGSTNPTIDVRQDATLNPQGGSSIITRFI
jgi:hypothetical protein